MECMVLSDAVDVVIGEKNIAIINRDGTVYITGSNENRCSWKRRSLEYRQCK